jgi:hypothetical protein
MRRLAKDSWAYTFVFVLGYLVACGTTGTTKITTGGGAQPNYPRMMTSPVRNTAIFPNTGAQAVLASVFGTHPARADATVSNPSDLGQSFESVCATWGASFGVSIHATFGNSGLVPLNFGTAGVGAGNACEKSPIASVGADENGTPTGFPIFLQGTVNNLVAYGVFASGNTFRCLDTTDTSPLQDSSFVRAYYDLAHDAIVLGSGTTQLTLTYSISLSPGDDVDIVQVQWVKS